jgi:hypothetical protein
VGTYPDWVHELMRGDLTHAVLGPPHPGPRLAPGPVAASAWKSWVWNASAGTAFRVVDEGGPAIAIASPSPNDASLTRTVALKPSTNYIVTAEVRTENVEITEAGGTFGATIHAGSSVTPRLLTGTQPWTRLVLPFTTGPKETGCQIKLALGGRGSVARGRAFFRNVQVRQVGYPAGVP